MKIGTEVAVCHDGKWGRRVKGVVVGTRQNTMIKVKFTPPGEEAEVEFWTRVIPTIRHRRYSKSKYRNSYTLKHYKHFGGWAKIDYWCPWFAVYKWEKNDERG